MTCLYFRSLLDDFLDRELSHPLETALKAHLDVCEACRSEYEELARLKAMIAGLTVPEPTPSTGGNRRILFWRERWSRPR